MTLSEILDLVGAVLLLCGAGFTAVAALGVIRFQGLFARMHSASKPQLLGLMLLCAGITLTLRTWQWFLACTLVVAIQMVAAPVASHLLGRTGYRMEIRERQYLTVDELAEDDACLVDPHQMDPKRSESRSGL